MFSKNVFFALLSHCFLAAQVPDPDPCQGTWLCLWWKPGHTQSRGSYLCAGLVQGCTEIIQSKFSHIACVAHSCWPPIILTMDMWAQFTASFLASSHGSCKCGTYFTNIDPTAVTLQAVSGAMFPSGVHCQYLQSIQFGNQTIFYFFDIFQKFNLHVSDKFKGSIKSTTCLMLCRYCFCCFGPC